MKKTQLQIYSINNLYDITITNYSNNNGKNDFNKKYQENK